MSKKEKITKYYKINISENNNGITEYKCYKVSKETSEPTVISYDLENIIKELSNLKRTEQKKFPDKIGYLLNLIEIGVVSFFFLNFIVKII